MAERLDLRYPDWETLINSKAWRNYLEDPLVLFKEWIAANEAEEEKRTQIAKALRTKYKPFKRNYHYGWITNQESKRTMLRDAIKDPNANVSLKISSCDQYFDPDKLSVGIRLPQGKFDFGKLKIGEFVGALALDIPREFVLQIANSLPTREDGLQLLSNYSGKDITPIIDGKKDRKVRREFNLPLGSK